VGKKIKIRSTTRIESATCQKHQLKQPQRVKIGWGRPRERNGQKTTDDAAKEGDPVGSSDPERRETLIDLGGGLYWRNNGGGVLGVGGGVVGGGGGGGGGELMEKNRGFSLSCLKRDH